jgi:primosomal protein N'
MVNPLVIDPWIWKNPGPFRVGDRVRIPFGTEQVEALVVEDRGNLGEGGKRIYRLVFRVDDVPDEISTERVVDDLTLIARAVEADQKGPKPKRPRD